MKWILIVSVLLSACGGSASSSEQSSTESSVGASDAAIHGHHTVMTDCYKDGLLSSCAVEIDNG